MPTHRFVPDRWYSVLGTFPPALTVADGDTVITETLDANGWDRDGTRRAGGGNPMNGPIFVAGAEPGDTLALEIVRLSPIRPTGWTRGALSANVLDPERARHLPPRDRIDWLVDEEGVRLKEPVAGLENLVLPFEPMIGCFGVAPAGDEAISTATSARHGGNMDYRGFRPGATALFRVNVPGALVFLGDCHAIQGDGEVVGTGVETAMEAEIRLRIRKDLRLDWPRGEDEQFIFTLGNARPLDQALQHATTEMLDWLTEGFGFSAVAAGHLLGQLARYEVGNVYDPAYTMVCKLEKKWLERQ